MPATAKRTARSEFPDYPVPAPVEEAVAAGLIDDTSWHNDVSPSYEVYGNNRREAVRLWLEHPNPAMREMGGPRCVVVPLKHEGMDTHEHFWAPDDEGRVLLKTDCVQEALDFVLRFAVGVAVGDRVRFKTAYDVFPFSQVKEGEMGTVVRIDREVVAVKLDAYHDGLDDWGNEAHFERGNASVDEDMAEFVLSVVEREVRTCS
jgi:hypothetical protein